jgi:hypothetical protein
MMPFIQFDSTAATGMQLQQPPRDDHSDDLVKLEVEVPVKSPWSGRLCVGPAPVRGYRRKDRRIEDGWDADGNWRTWQLETIDLTTGGIC